jgi:hypothetical protein
MLLWVEQCRLLQKGGRHGLATIALIPSTVLPFTSCRDSSGVSGMLWCQVAAHLGCTQALGCARPCCPAAGGCCTATCRCSWQHTLWTDQLCCCCLWNGPSPSG